MTVEPLAVDEPGGAEPATEVPRPAPWPRAGGPFRLVLVVGGVVGLLFALVAPPWSGGADEGTHFARSLEIAHGRLTPQTIDGSVGSPIPRSYRQDEDRTIRNFFGPAPITFRLVGDLLADHPDWRDTVVVDTQPTTAASPVAYLPSAMAMIVPDHLGAPGIVVMWAGRLGDLAVYLALALLAVWLATAFRWTLALAALFPMNLAMGASVTPDALTIGALLVVLALWTWIWRPPAPGSRVPVGSRAWPIAVAVGGAGAVLALAKPPYFLVLLAFPALLVVRWRDGRVRAAAVGASVAAAGGLALLQAGASSGYKAVTTTIAGQIRYQPDVQRQRLLSHPMRFLGGVWENWWGTLGRTVDFWSRQLGFWTSGMPAALPWVVLCGFVVGAVVLDGPSLRDLRRYSRAVLAVGTLALVVLLYVAGYLYFDDTVSGVRMGLQIPRYTAPLFALAIMGWAPRWRPVHRLLGRVPAGVVVGVVVALEAVVAGAAAVTWVWIGRAPS